MLAFLCSLDSELRWFVEAAEFSDSRPYGRRLLLKTAVLEVLVMGFYAGRNCPPHDHGGSDGLVLVCGGAAEHQIYLRDQGRLILAESIVEPAGKIIAAPVDCIHAMGNSGPEPLVTLHVYWPPIEHMTIFDLESSKVYEVSSKAGAWLPVDPETVMEVHPLE